MIAWIVAAAALVAALVAWIEARRAAARVELLSQMCWALQYRLGEIEARTGAAPAAAPMHAGRPADPPAPAPHARSFVPLASLER